MMAAVQLSICIPIYNCAEFVGQALDSILPQTSASIQVIVYDGGSTDETPGLMESYIKAWPNLQYHRGICRGGIDADMEKCASIAKGEYIWLFSGDDVMRTGAIKRALKWIEKGDDVYLCEHTLCNRDMVILKPYPMLTPDKSTCTDLSNQISRLEWFRCALTTEPFFSFMSSLLVRKETWQSGRLIEKFNGSCWGHVARLFELIPSGLKVCYVAEVWLDMRGGNDSFADKGVVNRYRIAIEGYHQIADTFFGRDSEEAFHIRRVIRNEFTLLMFMHAKWLCKKNPHTESKVLLDQLVHMAYSDNSAKEKIFFLIYSSSTWFFAFARLAYKSIMLGPRLLKKLR